MNISTYFVECFCTKYACLFAARRHRKLVVIALMKLKNELIADDKVAIANAWQELLRRLKEADIYRV